MKKKVYNFFKISTLAAIGVLALASCTKDSDQSTTTAKKEVDYNEIYYCNTTSGHFVFTKIDDKFTLNILGKTYKGDVVTSSSTYTLEATGLTECSAVVSDSTLTLTYNGNTYLFYKNMDYSVTYNVNDTSTSELVLNGSKLNKPDNPVVDGMTFIGWYSDSSYKTLYDFDSAVTKDITLYARFVEGSSTEFKAKLYDGNTLYSEVESVGGTLYNLPTLPDKDGASFVGWWCSDYFSNDKLTYQYKNQQLTSDVSLYAVYDTKELHLSVSDSLISWNSLGSGTNYSLSIYSSDELIGTFKTPSTSYAFDFKLEDAGEYKVVVTCGGKSATAYFANKVLSSVSGYNVVDNVLVFDPVLNATGYKITVVCNDSEHNHTSYDLGNNTYFDFSSCEMKKGGIEFYVTAYSNKYASSVTSKYIYDRTLSSVDGLKVVDDVVMWNSVNNATSYTISVNDDVYEVNSKSFSIKEYTGDLTIKVSANKEGYNSSEDAVLKYNKTTLKAPTNINVNNLTITWDEVEGAKSYVVSIDGVMYSVDTASYTISSSLEVSEEYEVCVKAVASEEKNSSSFSDTHTFNYLKLDNVTYSNKVVSWNSVLGAVYYGVVVNGEEEVKVTSSSYDIKFNKSGKNTIKVCYYNSKDKKSAYTEIEVYTYEIKYEPLNDDNTKKVASEYYAFADTITLPTATKTGYDLVGWYTDKENGKKYTSSSLMPAKDLTLYAYWTPKEYLVSYVTGDDATIDNSTGSVYYKSTYTLDVPVNNSVNLQFDGWYTESGGKGTKMTDSTGKSVSAWNFPSDLTLYAKWVNVLSYEEIKDSNGNVTGYKAVAGAGLQYVSEVTVLSTYNGKYVKELGSLQGASKLVKLNIPSTLSYIDTQTGFTSCYKLEAINVYDVEGYKDEVKYSSYDGILYYNNTLSTTIGYEVSYVPYNLRGEVKIMEGCVSIPQKAFYYSYITKITIPYTVSVIGEQAFYYSDLVEVEFEETPFGVDEVALTLENRSFYGCYDMIEITLPKRTASIYMGYVTVGSSSYVGNSFVYCSKLEKINIEDGCEAYKSVDGVVYSADNSTLICVPGGKTGELKVAGGTLTIAAHAARSCYKITSIYIPGSVRTIEEYAFYYCYKTEDVTFEEDGANMSIASNAFYYSNIKELTIPARVKVIESSAFSSCYSLKVVNINSSGEISIGTGVTSYSTTGGAYSYVTTVNIGADCASFDISGAFNGANDLLASVNVDKNNQNFQTIDDVVYNKVANGNPTRVIFYPSSKTDAEYQLPSTVTAIAAGCFKNKKFTKFTIGKNITEIADQAFYGCNKLTELVFEDGGTNDLTIGVAAFRNCSSLKSVTLPSTVVSLNEYAFAGCSALEAIKLNEGLVSIDDYAFSSCSKLTSITIPSTLTTLNGTNIFSSCNKLAEISVSDGNTAFKTYDGLLYTVTTEGDCDVLSFVPKGKEGDVHLPSTITKIGDNAFYQNTNITSVVVDGNKTTPLTLGTYAFYSCSNLTSVSLPGLTNIAKYAFNGCSELTTFEVPNTVTTIEERAFGNCSKLINLTFEAGGSDDLNFITTYSSSYYSPFYDCGIVDLTLPERTKKLCGYLFYDCQELKTVTLPSSVTEIPTGMFYYTSSLESVTYKGDVTSIGTYAFASSGIKNITLPNTVTTLGTYAFLNSAIESFVVPKNVVSIPSYCFYNCETLKEFDYGESKLTSIESYAFDACTSLTSFVVQSSVEKISDYAFYLCSKLKTITFEENSRLTSIGSYAFSSTSISEFTFPTVYDASGNVTTLSSTGSGVFADSENLSTVTLSESVENVSGLFNGLTNLKTINISANNKYIKEDNGVILNYEGNTLALVYNKEGTYTIPKNITTISSYAFSSANGLDKVILPNSVVSVGEYAFSNNSSITSIEFASDSTAILGDKAFYMCSSLKTLTLPTYISEVTARMFYGCSSLTSISLPNVTSIKEYAFSGCTSLLSLDLSNVEKIDQYAFYNCTSLKNIDLSDKITSFGQYAFYKCESLTSINTYEASLGIYLFSGCTSLSNVTLSENLTSIPNGLFYRCSSLKTVDIPENVTSIGYYCFYNSGIETITIPESVTSINYYTFYNCENLKSADLSKSQVTSIPGSMFYSCSSLTDVKLPETLTEISYNAFYKCSSLTNITLPSTLTFIGYYAFAYTGLTSITIPENVDKMAGNSSTSTISTSSTGSVFYGCEKLTSVNFLTTKLNMINSSTFYGCKELSSINLPTSVTTICSSAFNGCALESIDLTNVSSLQSSCFLNNTMLSSITFSTSLEALPSSAFSGCSSLTSVTLPANITTLSSSCFSKTGLTEIDLNGVTTLSSSVFKDCDALKKVKISSSMLTEIPSQAFSGCVSLQSFEAGENVAIKTIGASAFSECLSLKSLPDFMINELQTISDYAFDESGLTGNFEISSTVTSIGSNPFIGCKDLNVSVNKANTLYLIQDGSLFSVDNNLIMFNKMSTGDFTITKDMVISPYAFDGCSNLNIKFSDDFTTITKYMFAGLSDSTFEFTSSLTTLNDYAFAGCDAISSFIIPSSITTYGKYLFRDSNLKSVTIPSTLTTIPTYMFAYATNLTNVSFVDSSNIELIDSYAFYHAESLDSFTFPSNLKEIKAGAFSYSSLKEVILPEGLETLGTSAFYNNVALTKVYIPGSVKKVTYGAFNYCESLTDITLSEGVEELESCFEYCTSLNSITLPSTITYLYYTFYESSNLTSVKFLGSPAKFGYSVFYNCNKISKLVIPSENLIYLESYAFETWESNQTICFTTSESSIAKALLNAWCDISEIHATVVYNYSETE